MEDPAEVAIKVSNVSKVFELPHEKNTSIKSAFINFYRRRRTYEEQQALKNISFEVKKGEFFGIVGRNGSGKSTLLKIIANIYQPTSGSLEVSGKLVPFIELGVGFNPELTGRENVFLNGALLGFSEKEVREMYKDIVEFAELQKFMDQKLKNYSSGMQVRLAFSMAIRSEADILLIDEVLAVGDADFQKKCYKYFRELKRNDKTVIFVSHDMNAVQEYCDRAILIEKSQKIVEGASYDVSMAYIRMFLEQDENTDNISHKKKRWGSGELKYSNPLLDPDYIGPTDRKLVLKTKAVVKKPVQEAVLGFKIRTEDDTVLVGTNTKLKRHHLKDLKQGQEIEVNWTFPNIFNTGNYSVDLAIQSENYEDVFDWWEGAVTFQVDRQEGSSYSIHPIIDMTVETRQ